MKKYANIVGVLGAIRTAAVGSYALRELIGEKIYPFAAPDTAEFPYAVMSLAGLDVAKAHSGQSRALRYDVMFDVYSYGQVSVAETADALINGLINVVGRFNDVDIVRIEFLSADTQSAVKEVAGESEIIYAWSLTFRVVL